MSEFLIISGVALTVIGIGIMVFWTRKVRQPPSPTCDCLSYPNRIHIRVTKDDIRRGVRKSIDSCPIALGAKTAGFDQALITPKEWFLVKNGHAWHLVPGQTVTDWIMAYDRGEAVPEVHIPIDVPAEPHEGPVPPDLGTAFHRYAIQTTR